MKKTDPPVSNTIYGPPPGMEESQIGSIATYCDVVPCGPVEGLPFAVVAWEISDEEIELLKKTKKVYISMLGRLTAHFLSVSFEESTYGKQRD